MTQMIKYVLALSPGEFFIYAFGVTAAVLLVVGAAKKYSRFWSLW